MLLSDLRILVIDDSETMSLQIKESLKSIGIKRISCAKNGKAGLEMLKTSFMLGENHKFNIVICDWLMPNLSGLEVLKSIRTNDVIKDIPFIMLTSVKDQSMVTEAIASGVSSYILKPFNANTLYEKIEYVLYKDKKS